MIIPSCSTDLEDGHDGGGQKSSILHTNFEGFFFEKGEGEGEGRG